MKKLLNFLKQVALYIWQLPQNLLGLIFILCYKPTEYIELKNGNKVYFSKNMSGGISLGKYSIISRYYFTKYKSKKELYNSDIVKHEAIGHGTQSRILGPLYLLVIGLPSLIWAWLYGEVIPYTKNGYYKFYTEKWADTLADIKR